MVTVVPENGGGNSIRLEIIKVIKITRRMTFHCFSVSPTLPCISEGWWIKHAHDIVQFTRDYLSSFCGHLFPEIATSESSHRQSRSLLEQRLRARNSTRSKCSIWVQVGRNFGASGSGRGSGAGSGAPEHHAPEHRTVS